jgi:hypothetical protein
MCINTYLNMSKQVLKEREDMIAKLKNEQRQQELKNEYQLMYSNANQVVDNLQHASGIVYD